jgi:hypothetical protein
MSAKKTGGRAVTNKATGKKSAGKKSGVKAAGKKSSAKAVGKKAAAKKNGAAKKGVPARARTLSREEIVRRFPELAPISYQNLDLPNVKFVAATTGRVVKSSPVQSRLGDARIEAAVRAVVERRSGRSG